MSCKKTYHYEMTVVMEEIFDSVEEATNQKHASEKASVNIIDTRLVKSLVKKEEEHGVQPFNNKGTSAEEGKGGNTNEQV
jgi:hypothetical protein